MSAVVSDSSPLIYLALLSDFLLLREIYGSLVIPPAVHAEVVENADGYPVREAVEAGIGEWIEIAAIPDHSRVLKVQREHGLDLGESEAIIVSEDLGSLPLLYG